MFNFSVIVIKKLLKAIHDHPFYCVCPDILSLVGDPLSGNGCGSPNHTYSLSYFFLVYIPVLQLTQRKRRDCTCTRLSPPSPLFYH